MDLNCNAGSFSLSGDSRDWRNAQRRVASNNEPGAPSYSPQAGRGDRGRGDRVRWDRVRELRRQIAAGTYETEAKWVETLARLRQALGG